MQGRWTIWVKASGERASDRFMPGINDREVPVVPCDPADDPQRVGTGFVMDAATRALVEQVEQLADDRITRNAEIKRLREQIAGMVPCDDAAIERFRLAQGRVRIGAHNEHGVPYSADTVLFYADSKEDVEAGFRAAGETP